MINPSRQRFRRPVLFAIALTAITAFAQQPPSAAFEVASIKLSPPPSQGRIFTGISGGPGSNDPLHATFTRVRLGGLISFAYGLKPHQYDRLDARLQEKEFDINASLPAGATQDQYKEMMRALLAERFHLKVHWEKKSADVYDLVQAKGGHKLKPPTAPGESKPLNGIEKDEQNLPKMPPGVTMQICAGAGCRMQQIGTNLDRLILILSADLNAPIVDATGLGGQTFDYVISYGSSAPTANAAVDAPPPLATAISDQLGLRLEKRKGEVDTLIVDSVDREPTEN